ncbi:MAG TPA: TonB-dependent receptor [Bryobacteraceae bacterium]|nr:TonB-dependent receptor [Bryobacteraceae bacterium]
MSRINACALLAMLALHFAGDWCKLTAQTTSVIGGTVLDSQGLAVAGAEITVGGAAIGEKIKRVSDQAGAYRFLALPPGVYDIRATKPGFGTALYESIQLAMNSVLVLNIEIRVGTVQQEVRVFAGPTAPDAGISSSGGIILPQQIEDVPINGRNYLDLMQLVPGVAINQRVNAGTDAAVPILGERGGNAIFLIDGMPNRNSVDGGSSAPFDQNSILEFQVLTAGYKAEFGHGSGGVVNVVSKSGTGQWHGLMSVFHRNSALDSSDVPDARTPFLLRWDPDANLGGPLLKDRLFFFGSVERIRETRALNFSFPPGVPDFLRVREETFDRHNQTFETRSFLKLDERLGTHRLAEQMSLTNAHVTNFLPLSQATSLPSTRTDSDSRFLMWGFHDTATLGDQSNPFLFNAYLQYRGEPFAQRSANPQASPATTLFNLFSGLNTGRLTGDLGQVQFGAGFTRLLMKQRYFSSGANLNRVLGRHDIKVGWDFQRTGANGMEASNLLNQLFATTSDFGQFGPVNAGVYVLTSVAGQTAGDNRIHLSNLYNGLFAQDDWKVSATLTLNLGLRWDYDSRFPNGTNFSPRLGLAWSPQPKTIVNASWGVFYDNFRLGLARDIPGFGGANLFRNQTISFPRLFYGDPSTVPLLGGLCPSPVLTDSQIAAAGATCPTAGLPLTGVDRLNGVVAPGHAAIPPNTVVSLTNVQSLTGLTPQQFADAASAAVARQPGFFFWGGFGNLTVNFLAPRIFAVPITVDPGFRTPNTRAFHFGVQREIVSDLVILADYYHRDIKNILGVRTTNLAFEARIPGHTGQLQAGMGSRPILSYGPWYEGRYDGVSIAIRRRMSKGFTAEASYIWTNAIDNAFNSSFVTEVQTGLGAGSLAGKGPTDGFVGVPPVVMDPATRQTNENASFIASNGNPVPQAGKFYNGANLDRGPSDLALSHTFMANGVVQLPWQFKISGIFRVQSGFHFSGSPANPTDVDGDGILNGVDFSAGRNHFTAPAYVNVDMRFSKRFTIREKVRVQAMIEFFNLLNRANPAAVQQLENLPTGLGTPLQYLPGREGQVGLRFEF